MSWGLVAACVLWGTTGAFAQEATPQLTVSTVSLSQELPSRGRLGGMTIDAEGNLYVSNFSASLWRVGPDGAVERLPVDFQGSSGNTVLPDGRILQASFLEDRIVEIGRDGASRTYADEHLQGPVGLVAGEDGTVYVCNCRGNSITAVDADGSARVLAAGADFDCPNGITLGPDGAVYVVNFNDARVVRLDPSNGDTEVFATLPQGRNAHIAFAAGAFWITRIATSELYRVDMEGNGRRVLGGGEVGLRDGPPEVAQLAFPNGIVASPDGRFLYMNNLEGPWREDTETRIVIRRVGPLPGAGGDASVSQEAPASRTRAPDPDPSRELGAGEGQEIEGIQRIRIPVGEMVFGARAAGPEDGETVLLLHGFPETSYAFRYQLRALGALGFRAVAPDQRGYSPGARPEEIEAYGMAALSQDVADLADALGAERFDLVGHDWGGAVAWVVASRWPERVKTLTVLSTPHYGALSAARAEEGSDQAQRSSYFRDFAAPDAAQRFLAEDAAYLRSIYGALDPTAVEVYLKALGTPEALRAALAWYAAAFGPSSGPRTQAAPTTGPPQRPSPVTVPTLYVWSTEDGSFGRETAEATAEFVTGPYRFETLEGVSHWIPEEAPETVTRLIVEQIRGAQRGRRPAAEPGPGGVRRLGVEEGEVAGAPGEAAPSQSRVRRRARS